MLEHFYDRNGEPISFEKYLVLKKDLRYIVLAQTFSQGYRISTVWFGEDLSYGQLSIPLLFETMIFGSDGSVLDYQRRHATEQLALEGHRRAVAWLRRQVRNELLPSQGP